MKWFTVQQVAERLEVHPESVRRWIKQKRLPAARVGNRHRISESALVIFIASEARRHMPERNDEITYI